MEVVRSSEAVPLGIFNQLPLDFEEILPLVKSAVEEALFLAIDTELTGKS
jgi:hypothetical protein